MPARRSVRRRSLALVALLGLVPLVPALAADPGAAASGSTTPVAGVDASYQAGRVIDGVRTPSRPVSYDGEPLRVAVSDTGRRAIEPTIGVDKKGEVYYAAANHTDAKTVVLPVTHIRASSDAGASWRDATSRVPVVGEPNPPVNGDPYVYVDQDTGRVFNPENGVACLYLNFSDDQAKTWTTNPLACGGLSADHQSFGTGPFPPALAGLKGSYPKVVWYCSNHIVDSTCSRSTDGGVAWTPTGTPAYTGFDPTIGSFCGGLTGHLDTDSAGRVFLPKGHCGQPWLSVSSDGGATWTRTRVAAGSPVSTTASTHIAMAVDDADNVYVLWWDAERRLPWLAVSTDHGATFGKPMMVAPPGVNEVNFPEIEAGAAGRLAIVFPGTRSTDRGDTRRPWDYYAVVTTDALSADPTFVSTTASTPTDPLHRGNCGPGRCGGMWDFIDVVLSPVDGSFWSTGADTCQTGSCRGVGGAVDPDGAGVGIAVHQLSGPRLRDGAPPPGNN